MIIFIFSESIERNKTHIYSNNIITLNETKLRYVNFASNSKGDMIFYSTAYPKTNLRAFYGFKNNGRPFFKNENYFNSINSYIDQDQEKYESRIFFLEQNSRREEYLISVGKANSYVEIYDFDSNSIKYNKKINEFYDLLPENPVISLRNEAILLDKNTSGNYYLLGFTYKIFDGKNNFNRFCLQIHNFNFNRAEISIISKKSKSDSSMGNPFSELISVSCFKTENKYIMCFYVVLPVSPDSG